MESACYWSFSVGWWNVPNLMVVIVAQLSEYAKTHWILLFMMVNFMACKLYFNLKKALEKQGWWRWPLVFFLDSAVLCSEGTMRPCLEQTISSSFCHFIYMLLLWISQDLGSSLCSPAQLTKSGHASQTSLTTEDTSRELHHKKAVLKMCQRCKALTPLARPCSSLALACTLGPGLAASPKWEHILL